MKKNIKDNCTQKNNLTESEIRKRLQIVFSVSAVFTILLIICVITIGLVHSWDFVLTLIPIVVLAVAVIGTSTILVIPKCFEKIEQKFERIDVAEIIVLVISSVIMGLVFLSNILL